MQRLEYAALITCRYHTTSINMKLGKISIDNPNLEIAILTLHHTLTITQDSYFYHFSHNGHIED